MKPVMTTYIHRGEETFLVLTHQRDNDIETNAYRYNPKNSLYDSEVGGARGVGVRHHLRVCRNLFELGRVD